jgi:hypothetical protein
MLFLSLFLKEGPMKPIRIILSLVVGCAMTMLAIGCANGNSNPISSTSEHGNGGVAIVLYVQGATYAKDTVAQKCVIMLYAQLADTVPVSSINQITFSIEGDGIIGTPISTPRQVMWTPDTGTYKVIVSVLRKDGTYLSNYRYITVGKGGAYVVGDSIVKLTYGAKTVQGLLPVTIRMAATLFTDPTISMATANPKIPVWGQGQGLNGKYLTPVISGGYYYGYDTLYPNSSYSMGAIATWNGTNANSIWADTNKCRPSYLWSNGAFRFMTPPVDSIIVVDTSILAESSGDVGTSWLMKIKMLGDTTTYLFNPSLNATQSYLAAFVVNGVPTNVQLTNGGVALYVKLSRAQLAAFTSSDGIVHVSYGGTNMSNSVFYLASSGDLGYHPMLAKRKA